ncbi:hypothetical protein ACVHYJ_17680 [Burkholderia pyrrocinia]
MTNAISSASRNINNSERNTRTDAVLYQNNSDGMKLDPSTDRPGESPRATGEHPSFFSTRDHSHNQQEDTLHQLQRKVRQAPSNEPVIIAEKSKLDKTPNPKNEAKSATTKPNGLYRVSYTIPTPDTGLRNITFPMRIDEGQQRKSSQDAGNYYAMQFDVNDTAGGRLGTGYIGLQPREDGKALVVFSGFGANFKAPDGRSEADGGPGASNSTTVDFQFGHTYNLTVQQHPDDANILQAYIQDVTDPSNPGAKQWVKNLHVTQDAILAGEQTGFVEHYGAGINNSAQIKQTSGSFSAPFTTDDSGNVVHGSLSGAGLYGRYANSITGDQTATKEGGQIKKVEFSLHGVA